MSDLFKESLIEFISLGDLGDGEKSFIHHIHSGLIFINTVPNSMKKFEGVSNEPCIVLTRNLGKSKKHFIRLYCIADVYTSVHLRFVEEAVSSINPKDFERRRSINYYLESIFDDFSEHCIN